MGHGRRGADIRADADAAAELRVVAGEDGEEQDAAEPGQSGDVP